MPHAIPDRTPDDVVTLTTAANQAQIYRLSGDLNPLHIDPDVAKAGGFDAPILHGLATYGVIGRALLAARCGNEPVRPKRLDGRFSSPVYPREPPETSIWDEQDGKLAFLARVVERAKMNLTHAYSDTARARPESFPYA